MDNDNSDNDDLTTEIEEFFLVMDEDLLLVIETFTEIEAGTPPARTE
jgi:hypothetical protein